MQRKTYSLSLVLGLVIALFACTSAFAASPAQDVYNPDGDVLDFVATATPTPTSDTEDNTSTCGENNGSNGSGNSDSENCGTTTTTTTCSGTSGSGVAGSGGSGCGEVEQASVCGSNGSGTSGSSTSGSGSNGCGTTTPVVSKGQLPFTGFQAGLVGLMGLALLGGGITMRRLTRRQD
jgi:hypothetical protein